MGTGMGQGPWVGRVGRAPGRRAGLLKPHRALRLGQWFWQSMAIKLSLRFSCKFPWQIKNYFHAYLGAAQTRKHSQWSLSEILDDVGKKPPEFCWSIWWGQALCCHLHMLSKHCVMDYNLQHGNLIQNQVWGRDPLLQKRHLLRALTKQETSVSSQSSLVSCPIVVLKVGGYRAGFIQTLGPSLETVPKRYNPGSRRMAKKKEHNSEAQLSDYSTGVEESVLLLPFLRQLRDLAFRWYLDTWCPLAKWLDCLSSWVPGT